VLPTGDHNSPPSPPEAAPLASGGDEEGWSAPARPVQRRQAKLGNALFCEGQNAKPGAVGPGFVVWSGRDLNSRPLRCERSETQATSHTAHVPGCLLGCLFLHRTGFCRASAEAVVSGG